MEEDIDVLIDEFEEELKKHTDISTKRNIFQSKKKPFRSELSVDVDDLLTLDLDESWQVKPNSNNSTVKKTLAKCFPTFIGSPDFPLGVTKPGITRTCSSLFCSNCDFKVTQFLNYEWTDDPDYIFLRTNMPNIQKVREKLKTRKGSCAYACQCIAYSTRTLLALHAAPSLPWFCRGHQ